MDGIIDTSKTYMFTSDLSGSDLVLAVATEGGNASGLTLSMANASEATTNGQWFLTRVNGNQPGIFYRMHPASLGVAQSLDVVNEGGAVTSTRLKMAPSGDSSGQAWRFDRWSDSDSEGYRLSNKLTGPDIHLDLTSGTLDARLFGGDFPGQHWTLADAAGAATAATGGGSGGGLPLSTTGIVGLAVVAGSGLCLLLGVAVWWFMRSRSRKRKLLRAPAELSAGNLDRKPSVQSFQSSQSGQSYQLHQLQTVQVIPDRAAETISPATSYAAGADSIAISRSNTGLSGRTLASDEAKVQSILLAELPDKKY